MIHDTKKLMIVAGFVVIFLMSCSSSGPVFQRIAFDSSSAPLLYIYRPESDCMESIKIDFLIDDTYTATLRNNEYSYVQIKPGKNLIISGAIEKEKIPSLKIMIKTERGNDYYVKYEIECKADYGILNTTFSLQMMQVEGVIARSQIANTTLASIPNQFVGRQK